MINLIKYFQKHDPILFTLVYMAIMVFFTAALIYYPQHIVSSPRMVQILSWFFVLGPVTLAIFHVKNYKKTMSSMARLMSLYMQVVMMFGCIHFYSGAEFVNEQVISDRKERESKIIPDTIMTPNSQNIPTPKRAQYKQSIKGINSNWISMINIEGDYDKKAVLTAALKSFYDSIHFSLMTSTTVGYGDMYPITFSSKLKVDIQVLVSLFIMAFGVGSFFSKKESKS